MLLLSSKSRNIDYPFLNAKLSQLWSIQFPMVAIGSGYFIVKFGEMEQLMDIATGGPWFVQGVEISMQFWSPNFVCKNPTQASIVWVRLPNLLIKYFDHQVLIKVGNSLGKLLKVDTYSVNGDRGRFARLCIQVLNKLRVPSAVNIDDFIQNVIVETGYPTKFSDSHRKKAPDRNGWTKVEPAAGFQKFKFD
ncbi:hypothetical protein L6164_008220 [Bauhinia variegata]|uniref:Uncharacterized protein n=1 Tax=Bauhinia variegata TaxID=167791 RepID=A0ACB9PLK0_BAUVA|nr:hypothetical protein L6164_008220 [Bauhinia variegata]